MKSRGISFEVISYFEGGIKDTVPKKQIEFNELIELIKNNPKANAIEHIRLLRKQGKIEYKKLKDKLPYITPNCSLKKRKLTTEIDFQENFICPSGYIFFDIDEIKDVEEYKKYFIEKYGHLVSLVASSTSLGGISTFFKLKNHPASKSEYFQVWETIRTTILKDEKIDINCKDFGRALFVSYDTSLYYNFENEIDIKDYINEAISNSNSSVQNIVINDPSDISNYKFNKIPIKEVFNKLKLKTSVDVSNPLVEINPVDYSEVNFHKGIKDGTKHRIYPGMIHTLVFLNPDIQPDYIFQYLVYVNNKFAHPPMDKEKLENLFRFVYESITSNPDYEFKNIRTKSVHFKSGCSKSGDEKRKIAVELNGVIRKNSSIDKIDAARQQLEAQGIKITQKKIAEISGLSIATVKRRFKEQPCDLTSIIDGYNSLEIENEFIHPNCPQWAINYLRYGKFYLQSA